MPESEPDMEQLVEFTDNLITIRWDSEEGNVVYDLGEIDCWSAAMVLQRVFDAIYDDLPMPRHSDDVDGDDG